MKQFLKTKRVLLGFLLALVIAVPVLAAILNVVPDGSLGTINNAVFYQYIIDGSGGTGNLDSFLRLQANGSQTGYNTDGTLEFDSKSGSFTHSLKLSQVPQAEINGITYRAFILDLNQTAPNPEISLTELQLFTAATGNLTTYSAGPPPNIGGATTLVYNLDSNEDNTVQMELKDSGSGKTDYVVYIPDSAFGAGPECDFGQPNAGCSLYVYLYSTFTGSNDGFEEWSVATVPNIIPTPSPTPTNTPVPPTNTSTPTDTPTNTPVPPTATPTDTPTNTPVPPTATPTDTPTNTPVPPTATPTDTPTNTPVPPTNTPTSTPTNTPVTSICAADAGAYELTTLIGKGMGSNTAATNVTKVFVPNPEDVIELYGQLAGKDQRSWKYARFIRPNGTYINDKTLESPAFRQWAVFWYGQNLTPTTLPHWRARLIGAPTNAPFVQRAFILYPTYQTETEYVNVWETFADSSQNHVFWEGWNNWFPTQQQVVSIAPPQLATEVTVSVALVDNDKDNRPFELTISAGAASQTVIVNGPTNGNLLNIVQVTLPIAAGVDEIVLDLVSPSEIGDSVAMTGMTAHYPCEPVNGN